RADADSAREEAAARTARAGEELAAALARVDALTAELTEARAELQRAQRASAADRARLVELDRALADRDAAQRRAGQLADQVSDLATALARISAQSPG
ncbi:hypothetical protein AB0K29_31865, partial [Micromonospora humida]